MVAERDILHNLPKRADNFIDRTIAGCQTMSNNVYITHVNGHSAHVHEFHTQQIQSFEFLRTVEYSTFHRAYL